MVVVLARRCVPFRDARTPIPRARVMSLALTFCARAADIDGRVDRTRDGANTDRVRAAEGIIQLTLDKATA